MLRRMVTVAHCRSSFEAGMPIWKFAFEIDVKVRQDTNGEWRGLRTWQYYAAGECEISSRALKLMEKAAPGTIKLNDHAFWRLIDTQPLRHSDLVAIVQKLPPKYAAICLAIPDSNDDFITPNTRMDRDDFEALHSIGSLDAVAALLALSRLFEQDYFLGGERDNARLAAETATRLFGKLCLDAPFRDYADDIWPLLSQQYLEPYELETFYPIDVVKQVYTEILDFFRCCGFNPKWPQERMALLCIIDRRHFHYIASTIEAATKDPFALARYTSQAAIVGIMNGYTELFGKHFRNTQPKYYWPIPDEKLRALDQHLAPDVEKLVAA